MCAVPARNTLSRIIRAREALDDGDTELATQMLTELEADLTRRRRWTCPVCGCRLRFDFPGQLETHLRVSHPEVCEARVG